MLADLLLSSLISSYQQIFSCRQVSSYLLLYYHVYKSSHGLYLQFLLYLYIFLTSADLLMFIDLLMSPDFHVFAFFSFCRSSYFCISSHVLQIFSCMQNFLIFSSLYILLCLKAPSCLQIFLIRSSHAFYLPLSGHLFMSTDILISKYLHSSADRLKCVDFFMIVDLLIYADLLTFADICTCKVCNLGR